MLPHQVGPQETVKEEKHGALWFLSAERSAFGNCKRFYSGQPCGSPREGNTLYRRDVQMQLLSSSMGPQRSLETRDVLRQLETGWGEMQPAPAKGNRCSTRRNSMLGSGGTAWGEGEHRQRRSLQTADIPRRARTKLQLVCNWLSWDS